MTVALLVVAWIAASLLLVGVVPRDVHRNGGPGLLVFVLMYVFWPLGVYMWGYTRGRSKLGYVPSSGIRPASRSALDVYLDRKFMTSLSANASNK